MPGIVVGVDQSEHSRHALEWAIHEASVRHAPLTVLTVNQAVAGYWGGPAPSPGDREYAEKSLAAAKEETESLLEQAGEASRPASVTVRGVTGLPAEELVIASKDAEMLVVGSRGAGGFRRLLMGSVAAQVTHHAHCPVVVIPAENT